MQTLSVTNLLTELYHRKLVEDPVWSENEEEEFLMFQVLLKVLLKYCLSFGIDWKIREREGWSP